MKDLICWRTRWPTTIVVKNALFVVKSIGVGGVDTMQFCEPMQNKNIHNNNDENQENGEQWFDIRDKKKSKNKKW